MSSISLSHLFYLHQVLGVRWVSKDQAFTTITRVEPAWHEFIGGPEPRLAVVGCRRAPNSSATPFPGAPGELLHKMILAMKFQPSDVCLFEWLELANRDAHSLERLHRGILSRSFQAVLLLDPVCAELLWEGTDTRMDMGEVLQWRGIPVVATYDLETLMHHPEHKKQAWMHLQVIMKELESSIRQP